MSRLAQSVFTIWRRSPVSLVIRQVVVTRYRQWWAALDEAERLAAGPEGDSLDAAIDLASGVFEEASEVRGGLAPGVWDDGSWSECTVAMTRASMLQIRFRRKRATGVPPPATE